MQIIGYYRKPLRRQMKKTFVHIIFAILVASFLLSSCSSAKRARNAAKSYEIGEYYAAIEGFTRASKKEKDPKVRQEYDYLIAQSYLHIANYRLAEARLRNLVRREYPDTMIILNLAECYKNNGKYDLATETFNKYLEIIPGDERAINGLKSVDFLKTWEATPTRFQVNQERILSSRDADYSPVFIAGLENQIIFTSTREGCVGKTKSGIHGQRYADLFTANFDIQSQRWEKATPLDEQELINTKFDEGTPSLSADGTQLYFTRCRFDNKAAYGAEIFSAKKSRDNWSEATDMDIVSDSIIGAHPSISSDGQTLYFVSDMEEGYGGKDIWKVEAVSDGWGQPENLGPEVNTPGDEMFPYIRDNGELYFSSNYHPGMGGLDLFKAIYNTTDERWEVFNMQAPMNSNGDDFGITFLPKKDKGMFSSNRKGSMGDDLYSFELPPKIFKVEGEILNAESNSNEPNAFIRVIGTDGTNLKVRSIDGQFQYKMKPETEYIFAAFKDGFLNAKSLINTIDLANSKTFQIKLKITPTDIPINVDNVNYEFGKFELLESSRAALDSLVQLLTINPTTVIEIMSHTDFVGSDQFNSTLSQKRAQSVVDYLIQKGINPKRLVAKGYGETWPKTINKTLAKKYPAFKRGDELTEEYINNLPTVDLQETAKAINRRTEFRVLNTEFRD